MPRVTSVKNGLATSRTIAPTARLRPARSWRAEALRTKPRSSIARRTRACVVSATRSGLFSTFETVPTETPARLATSRMLRRVVAVGFAERAARAGRRRAGDSSGIRVVMARW